MIRRRRAHELEGKPGQLVRIPVNALDRAKTFYVCHWDQPGRVRDGRGADGLVPQAGKRRPELRRSDPGAGARKPQSRAATNLKARGRTRSWSLLIGRHEVTSHLV